MCKHGNCSKEVGGGEGVTISAAGYRVKFCGWEHAAAWVLAMGARLVPKEDSNGRFLRALAALEVKKVNV